MSEPLSDDALHRLLSMAAEEDDAGGAPVLPERYEVVRELGRGGMGIVYECHDHKLDRRCAVKTISAGAGADAALRRRFAREAQAAARLRHPNIAEVYDATEDYISMRVVRGAAIDVVDAGEPRDVRWMVERIRDAARALHHAHEEGVVHRDVKPSNLLVEDGHVFVVDFGLAKAIDHEASVSLVGGVVGTPAFMAPEQALGHASVDRRADVYGLGATLFCCLRQEPPFAADDLPALLRLVVDQDAPPLAVDRDLDVVVGKCLQKDVDARYASAAEFADDLDRWLAEQPILARPPSFGYRLKKRLRRQRVLWRAVAIAALLAIAVTALVLVPIAMRESTARIAASEAVELADHSAALVQEADLFARLGDTLSANEVLDRGIVRAREFLTRNEVPRVRYLLSRLLRRRGQLELAIEEATLAIDADPTLVDARFERGLMLAAAPRLTEAERNMAIADLEVGVGERSSQTSVDRQFGRGELLRLRGENDEAMELLRGVLEYDQLSVHVRLSLAKVATALGNDPLAQYYASSAFDLQRGYGSFFLAQQRTTLPTAILNLEGALIDFSGQLDPQSGADLATAFRGLVHLRRAMRLLRGGDRTAAIAAVRAAIEDHDNMLMVHPGLPGAVNNRAVCRLVLARLLLADGDSSGAAAARNEAIDDLQSVLRSQPMLAEAHANLGIARAGLAGVLRALGRIATEQQVLRSARGSLQAALQLRQADKRWPYQRLCQRVLATVEAAITAR